MNITIHKNSIIIRANALAKLDGHKWYMDELDCDECANSFEVGKIGTLGNSEHVIRDEIKNVWLAPKEGIGGNSDPSIKCTEGWRGTNNDIAIYANGVIEVTGKRPLANGYGWRITFKRVAV